MSAIDVENPPDMAVADDVAARTAENELVELRAELAKWRARVPKLANALKERSERVAQLEQRLESVSAGLDGSDGAAASADAGNEARQELIAELEIQQRRLKERCHTAEAKIHTQSLELAEAESDIRGWREKWQKLTLSLDEQSKRASAAEAQSLQVALQSAEALDSAQSANAELADRCEQLDQALLTTKRTLADREADVATLRARNEQLFETTEFANDQISALSTSVETQSADIRTLTAQLDDGQRQRDEAEAAAAAVEQGLREELDEQRELLARNAERLAAAALAEQRMLSLQTIEALNASALQTQHQTLERELIAVRVLTAEERASYESQYARLLQQQTEREAQLQAELTRLGVVAEVAVQEQAAADIALLLTQQDHTSVVDRLAAELEAQRVALDATRDQNDTASQALVRAQQAQSELEEDLRVALARIDELGPDPLAEQRMEQRVEQLEARLTEQSTALEAAAAEARSLGESAQQAHAQTLRQASEIDAAVLTVMSLEEQLATVLSTVELMRVQSDLAAANDAAYDGLVLPEGDDLEMVVQPNIPTPEETLARLSDGEMDKLLLVLNQQLADARSENERLLARLRAGS